MGQKKLYKDTSNKKISGVCAGIARYLGVDPTIIRLVWVVVTVFGSAIIGGTIAYLICALVMNDEPVGYTTCEPPQDSDYHNQQL